MIKVKYLNPKSIRKKIYIALGIAISILCIFSLSRYSVDGGGYDFKKGEF